MNRIAGNEAIEAIATVREFTGASQFEAMRAGLKSEEAQHFIDKFMEYGTRIKAMPVTYDTDGQGDAAVAHLHYFTAGADWWVTERDIDDDGEGQVQAFGLASLGYEPELGYISIKELLQCGAELDLHWTPRTLGEIKADLEAGAIFEAESPESPQEPPEPAQATDAPPEARSPGPAEPANDAEAKLRAIWTEKGVPEARQDELISDLAAKAAPGAMVGPFQIPEAKHRADLEAPYYQLAGQTQPRPTGAQSDLFGAAGLDRKPAGNLRHGGGTLI